MWCGCRHDTCRYDLFWFYTALSNARGACAKRPWSRGWRGLCWSAAPPPRVLACDRALPCTRCSMCAHVCEDSSFLRLRTFLQHCLQPARLTFRILAETNTSHSTHIQKRDCRGPLVLLLRPSRPRSTVDNARADDVLSCVSSLSSPQAKTNMATYETEAALIAPMTVRATRSARVACRKKPDSETWRVPLPTLTVLSYTGSTTWLSTTRYPRTPRKRRSSQSPSRRRASLPRSSRPSACPLL